MPKYTNNWCNCRCIKRIYRYLRCLIPNRCKNGIINQTDGQANHDDNTKEIIPIEIIEALSDVNISPDTVSNQPSSQKSYSKKVDPVNSETSDSTSSDDEDDKMRVRKLSIFVDNEYIRNSRNISEPLQSSTADDNKICLDKGNSDGDTSDEDTSDNKSEIIVNIEP